MVIFSESTNKGYFRALQTDYSIVSVMNVDHIVFFKVLLKSQNCCNSSPMSLMFYQLFVSIWLVLILENNCFRQIVFKNCKTTSSLHNVILHRDWFCSLNIRCGCILQSEKKENEGRTFDHFILLHVIIVWNDNLLALTAYLKEILVLKSQRRLQSISSLPKTVKTIYTLSHSFIFGFTRFTF